MQVRKRKVVGKFPMGKKKEGNLLSNGGFPWELSAPFWGFGCLATKREFNWEEKFPLNKCVRTPPCLMWGKVMPKLGSFL